QPRVVLGHRLLEDNCELPIDLTLALTISTLRRKPIAFVPAGSAVPALCLLALLPRLRLLLAGLLRFALLAPALRLLLFCCSSRAFFSLTSISALIISCNFSSATPCLLA